MSSGATERAIVLCHRTTTTAEEWVWGQRLCEELLRRRPHAEHVVVLDCSHSVTIREALAVTAAPNLGVVLDDTLLWGSVGWGALQEILDNNTGVVAVAPVSNEAIVSQQKVTPPFLYSTPALLQQVSHEHYQRYRGQWCEVPACDPFAFLVRRVDGSRLDPSLPLRQVPEALARQGGRLAVALDTYVHRYAPVYEQLRPDIQKYVPTDARCILDIGCAAGAFGVILKERQQCQVTGIEMSTILAEIATTRLDRVLVANVETVPVTTFTQEFDCITCGDVLEHLRDPWAVVTKFAAWLRPGGRLIATIPNIGHWSIVADLLRGRWDIVPFSLLSWEHVRFFTRSGVEQLFRGCGFTLEFVHGMKTELPEVGEAFLHQATALMPDADVDSLRTNEFFIVARKEAV